MYAKMQLTGSMEVVTGMHIGGSTAFSAIGAVNAPVVRDILSGMPIVPGSSFKGKMRSLLARQYNPDLKAEPNEDTERITRLFGSSKKEEVKRGRVLFRDMFLGNIVDLRQRGIENMVEIKSENRIQRLTSTADPRQIERIIKGAIFNLELIYEVMEETEIVEDIETLIVGMKLLQYDYLGGNGSRGYGQVKFEDLQLNVVQGKVPEEILKKCEEVLKEIQNS